MVVAAISMSHDDKMKRLRVTCGTCGRFLGEMPLTNSVNNNVSLYCPSCKHMNVAKVRFAKLYG